MKQKTIISAGMLLLALAAGCGGGGNTSGGAVTPPVAAASAAPPSPPPSATLASVTPSSIESGTNASYDAPDYFGTPVGTSKNVLFVMLPGTRGVPSSLQHILREGAARGYHVIGLTYVNGTEVDQYCATSSDTACWGDVRSTIIYGNGASPLVSIAPADSIVGRLRALLAYLAASAPTHGWGQFLANGEPVWSKIVVGGHSQGAGHAMYLAKNQVLAGACAFDSPDDGNASVGAAGWLSESNATAPGVLYGFTNQDDALASFGGVTTNWSLIGIPGPPADIDVAASPYGGSHQLYTVAPAAATNDTHGYTVVDSATPVVNGTPLFAPVWDTVCFP